MSGTLASKIKSSGGLALPTPNVRILVNGTGNRQHSRLQVGWISKSEWEVLKDYRPFVALWRHKRGASPTVSHPVHTGYQHDNTRGWVHPDSWDGNQAVSRRRGGGGVHSKRNGGPSSIFGIPRISEWDVTKAEFYDVLFEPEFWFLDLNGKQLSYPIQTLANGDSSQYTVIGKSGQSGQRTFSTKGMNSPIFCGSTRTVGTQTQRFAFSFGIDNPDEPSRQIFGPRSSEFIAEIYPKVLVRYDKQIFADRGRKILLRAG